MNNVVKGIKSFKSDFENYGLFSSICLTLAKIYPYSVENNNRLAYFLNVFKHKTIIHYLEKKYNSFLIEFLNKPTFLSQNNDNIIWSFWWQGEENAPDIVKLCFASMEKNKGNFRLIIINQNNFDQYMQLPEYILDGVKTNKIDLTHFSDLVRVYLLFTYGGIWLDSTILLLKQIPESLGSYNFYTGKLLQEKINCVSERRWNIAFLGGKRNGQYFDFILHFYYKYWESENKLIDYFLTDYMTQIAFDKLDTCKKEFQLVPFNNEKIFDLDLNDTYSEEKLKFYLTDTFVFKNQRRRIFSKFDKNNQITFYGYFSDLFK